jgi:hypothetical protein
MSGRVVEGVSFENYCILKIPRVRIPSYPLTTKEQATDCKSLLRLNNIIGNVLDCKSYNIGSNPILA